VPLLGKIPLIGNLFRVRGTQKQKTNLMVFIRPRVLRTPEQTAFETNSKYNYMRDLQIGGKGKVKLMPGEGRPTLPPIVAPNVPQPPPTETVPGETPPPAAEDEDKEPAQTEPKSPEGDAEPSDNSSQ
jgi:general secretion pathway protein D